MNVLSSTPKMLLLIFYAQEVDSLGYATRETTGILFSAHYQGNYWSIAMLEGSLTLSP